MSDEIIRILNFVPNMRAAGIESFIMNVYRNIDRSMIQFDFAVHSKKREFYDDEIESLGGKIYRFTYKDDKNLKKYIKDLNKFFKNNKQYTIVHGHMQSIMPLYLAVAKKNNVPVRIAHSHNNSYEKSLKGFVLHIFSRFSRCFSTYNYACSNDAGKYLFGTKKFDVIYNGINIDRFKYSDEYRKKIRNQLGVLDDEVLIGNVGRMEKQKNQLFLLKVFNEVYKQNKNYKLLIIGEGNLKQKLIDFVKENNIIDAVIFSDNISNVNEFMCSMDIFVLPSLYEGLGIVLIEAQANGLKCITTEKTVASETNITDLIQYLPLNERIWKKAILDIDSVKRNHDIKGKLSIFDIKCVADDLQAKYIELINNI